MSYASRFSIRSVASAALILAAACVGDATAPADAWIADLSPAESAIVTVDSNFVLRAEHGALWGDIPFQFTNLSDRGMSLPNCNGTYPIVLEKRNGDAWDYAWSGTMMGCISPPLVVESGATMSGAQTIAAGLPGSNYAPLFASPTVDGTYRLVLASVHWAFDEAGNRGVLVPERLRTSNEFTIRVE